MMTPFDLSTRLSSVRGLTCAAAAAVAALGIGCAAHDEMSPSDERALATEQAEYSDAECQAASPDARGRWGWRGDYVATTPATYSNPVASQAYVWDLTPDFNLPEVRPNVVLAGLSAADYDTQAECVGISLKRRLYRKSLARPTFQKFGEATVTGKWDPDLGCTLPRLLGPDIECGPGQLVGSEIICSRGISPDTTIRVCASAVKANSQTIPVTLEMRMTSSGARLPETFNNPQVRVSRVWQAIRAEQLSAAGYCTKRFLQYHSFARKPTPAFPYAYYLPDFKLWRVPLSDSTPQPILQTAFCSYPLSAI